MYFNILLIYCCLHAGTPRPKQSDLHVSNPTTITVQKIYRSTIDESHSIVQQLTEAGYTLEQSIEAVRLHKTLGAAMDYLDAKNTSDDSEDENIPEEQLFEGNYLEGTMHMEER